MTDEDALGQRRKFLEGTPATISGFRGASGRPLPLSGTRWDSEFETLILRLAPAFVQAMADETAHGGRIEFLRRFALRDPVSKHLLMAWRAEVAAGCPAGRLFGEALATALAAQLLRHHAVAAVQPVACRGGLPPTRLRRVRDHIEAHLGEAMSLQTLARLAELSLHHFCRAFKKSTGLPPHQYVLWRRLERGKALLADRRLSVTEVAFAAGFGGPSQFAHAFRRVAGLTPSAYRKSLL
jgi:AraC family transcriptional regulator